MKKFKLLSLVSVICLSTFIISCSTYQDKIYTPSDKAMQYSEVFIPFNSMTNQEYRRVMNFGDFQIIQNFKNSQEIYNPHNPNIKKPEYTDVLTYTSNIKGYGAILYSFDINKARQTIGDSKAYFTYVDHQINNKKQITNQIVGLNIIQDNVNLVIKDYYENRDKDIFKDNSYLLKKEVQKNLDKKYPGVFFIKDFKFYH